MCLGAAALQCMQVAMCLVTIFGPGAALD